MTGEGEDERQSSARISRERERERERERQNCRRNWSMILSALSPAHTAVAIEPGQPKQMTPTLASPPLNTIKQ
ncbi:hypothetical protein EJ04DRAFT_60618 [Polyplosphaeria fusca]|uniref:Uncharacterized protein n=1 Tax=Polyplosphaeria fusca TaxID=682080 RepID=A0A9P4R7P6_9PLEO|nr:hypothetical protein EJ04DRAFT_60618 [Polyplosphaeria fusca]